METLEKRRIPWRSWTLLALVLVGLALAQACSDSGHRTTGPTKSTAVALRVHRAAQIPAGCTGTLTVDGPNGFHLEVPIPASGEVSFQAPIGVPLTLTVVLNCGGQGTFTGSTSFTAAPGNNQAAVTVVATSAGVSCSPNPVAPGQTSTCVCTIKSPTSPSVTWQGATPSGPTTATFSNPTPGTYGVTCIVNNAASASTTVTVEAGTGTIRIFNDALLGLRTRDLASHLPFSSIFARVVGVSNTTREIDAGHSTTVSAPPGSRQVEGSCNSSFDGTVTRSVQVTAGQEVSVHFDVFGDFGNCD
jgi:hypothetical protein